MLTPAQAQVLGAGPVAELAARIAAATSLAELDELLLAVCFCPQLGQLTTRFRDRRYALETEALAEQHPSSTSTI